MHISAILVIEVILKGTAILLAGYGGAALLARSSAAHRSCWWLGVFATVLLLPALGFLAPPRWTALIRIEGLPAGWLPALSVAASPPVGSALDAPITAALGTEEHPGRPHFGLRKCLLAGYGSGVALVIAFRLLGSWQLWRLRRDCAPECEAQALIDCWRQSARFRRRVRVYTAPHIRSPMTWGIWRPVILLPDNRSGERTAAEFRAALQHEFAHIRHHDAARRWLGVFVSAVWWPHPLIWGAVRAWKLEQERACDDEVLNSGADPTSYAEQLLEAADGAHLSPYQNAGALVMATSAGLESRLRSVVSRQVDRSPVRAGAQLRIGALTLMATLGSMAFQAQPVVGASPKSGPEAGAIPPQKKAETRIIPKLEFREVTPAIALQKISELTGFKISYVPTEDDQANLSVSLTNVPASEALRYVADLADLKITYQDDGVYLQAGPDLKPGSTAIPAAPAGRPVRVRFVPTPPDGSIGNGADFSALHHMIADKPGVFMLMAHAGIGDSFPVREEGRPKIFDVKIVAGDDDLLKLEIRTEEGAKVYDLKRDGVVSVEIEKQKFSLAYPSITRGSASEPTTNKAMIIVNRFP